MTKITRDIVVDYIKQGGNELLNMVRDAYANEANRAFYDAIEIGIENTVSVLYEANLTDDQIINLLVKHWGITMEDAENKLILEKSQSVIRNLKHFLKMQGYTEREIQDFMIRTAASCKIRHEKELWKMKNNPEELFKVVQNNKKISYIGTEK